MNKEYTDEEAQAIIDQSAKNVKTFAEVAVGLFIAYAVMFGVSLWILIQNIK